MSHPESRSAAAREQPRKAAILFAFITLLLDVLALGITIPILPKLVESMLAGDTARAAVIFGLFSTAFALMQLIFQPVLGAMSDRFGRRPVILFSNLGLGLDYVLMALAPNLWWLFIGRVISGIAASSFACATAYIIDITPPEKRAEAFGMIGMAVGVGFVAGPAIGGLLGSVDPRLPLWVAAGCSLANAAYGYFVLPESLGEEKRAPFRWARANPIGSLRLLRSHPELLGLSGSMFLFHLAHNVFTSVFVLHAGYRFGWDEWQVGLGLATFAIFSAIVQAVLMKPMIAWLEERGTMLFGMAAGVVGFAAMGLAPTSVLFWTAIPVMALWSFIGPAMQAIMSRHVGESEQGQLQGASGALSGIAGLIGPTIFAQLFAGAIAYAGARYAGAPYLMAGLMLVASGLIAWRVTANGGSNVRH